MINLTDIKLWFWDLKERLLGVKDFHKKEKEENIKYWYYVNVYWVSYKIKITHSKIPNLEIEYFGNLATRDFVWDQQEYFSEAFMKFNQEIKNYIIESMIFSKENLKKIHNKYPETKNFEISEFDILFETLDYSLLNSRKMEEVNFPEEENDES